MLLILLLINNTTHNLTEKVNSVIEFNIYIYIIYLHMNMNKNVLF